MLFQRVVTTEKKKSSSFLYAGALKCLCEPEGALNKLPVTISKHSSLSFLLFFPLFFPLRLLARMSSIRLFVSVEEDWK